MNRYYVTPEWQLLFKSKSPREPDRQDFLNVLPCLSLQQQIWLHQACIQTGADVTWIETLAQSINRNPNYAEREQQI